MIDLVHYQRPGRVQQCRDLEAFCSVASSSAETCEAAKHSRPHNHPALSHTYWAQIEPQTDAHLPVPFQPGASVDVPRFPMAVTITKGRRRSPREGKWISKRKLGVTCGSGRPRHNNENLSQVSADHPILQPWISIKPQASASWSRSWHVLRHFFFLLHVDQISASPLTRYDRGGRGRRAWSINWQRAPGATRTGSEGGHLWRPAPHACVATVEWGKLAGTNLPFKLVFELRQTQTLLVSWLWISRGRHACWNGFYQFPDASTGFTCAPSHSCTDCAFSEPLFTAVSPRRIIVSLICMSNIPTFWWLQLEHIANRVSFCYCMEFVLLHSFFLCVGRFWDMCDRIPCLPLAI